MQANRRFRNISLAFSSKTN